MKIIEYLIITENYTGDMTRRINDYIAAGWQPFGGIAYNSNRSYYSQAVVKYAPTKSEHQ